MQGKSKHPNVRDRIYRVTAGSAEHTWPGGNKPMLLAPSGACAPLLLRRRKRSQAIAAAAAATPTTKVSDTSVLQGTTEPVRPSMTGTCWLAVWAGRGGPGKGISAPGTPATNWFGCNLLCRGLWHRRGGHCHGVAVLPIPCCHL